MARGRLQVITKGPEGFGYLLQNASNSTRFENADDPERFVTTKTRGMQLDQTITDNGDGTWTILVKGTGNETMYDADGHAIARNPGQLRWKILIDYNGTPSDLTDDVFLEDLGVVKGSTGRSDDFCEPFIAELGS